MTPPSPAITVRIVGATDVGLIREHNEDNFTVLDLASGESDFSQGRDVQLTPAGVLLVVCDGMGGAAAGEVASHMAVEVIRRELGPKGTAGVAASHSTDSKAVADKPAGLTGERAAVAGAGDPATAAATPTDGKSPEQALSPGGSPSDAASGTGQGAAVDTGAQTTDGLVAASKAAEGPLAASAPQSADKVSPGPAVPGALAGPAPDVSAAAMPPAAAEPEGPLSEAQLHGLARKLRLAGQKANQEIYEAACADLSKAGMGTTLTTLMLLKSHVIVGQVGDSRAYLWRRGKLVQITHDQSLVNQLLESGQITPEQAKLFEHSNVILQALGVQEDVEVVLSTETVRRDDRLLLCSDGLVGVVADEEIQEVLSTSERIEDAARRLIELARAGGGPDNITVIVAQIGGEGAPAVTDADVAEYRPLYLDGDKPPERRMWAPEYGFMGAPAGGRELTPGAAAPPPVSSRVSVASMTAVFALLVVGVLGAILYQPRRTPPNPPPIGTGSTGQGAVGANPSPPALPPPAAVHGADAGSDGSAAVAVDAGAVAPVLTAPPVDPGPEPPPAGVDGSDGSSAVEAPAETDEPDKTTKRRHRRKKSTQEEPTTAEPTTAPTPAVTAPVVPEKPADPKPEPAPDKGGEKPAAEKPAAEKPAVPAEKPAAPVEKPAEKPVAPAEKPAPSAEKPAVEKPAVEKPAAAPSPEKPAQP